MNLGPHADPLSVFAAWYVEHEATAPKHPDAMLLATASATGQPSVRAVLLKGVVDGEYRFFTNLESRKGRELADNPQAALLFFWSALGRQVRIEGSVTRVSDSDADAYFATRPRASQLSALVSAQSRPTTRDELLARRSEAEARLAGAPVPRPVHWGGFALKPALFEFWIADPDRLHFRHQYRKDAAGWRHEVLAP
ncbi:MAG: pyridoxamine 5'-phosphate oxidase [Myxococcales bacterium]|nr:pyridoxamine 5'-phosphate oxidase [Myxococcales bacterium]